MDVPPEPQPPLNMPVNIAISFGDRRAESKPDCPLSCVRNAVQRTPTPADFGAQSRVPAEEGTAVCTHTHTLSPEPLAPHNFQVHSHSLPGAGKDTPRPGAAAVLEPQPSCCTDLGWRGAPTDSRGSGQQQSPPAPQMAPTFPVPEHPHLLQLCSPSQVVSGQAAECKSTPNSLLHQASFGEPVASCSRLCSPCRLGGRKSKEGRRHLRCCSDSGQTNQHLPHAAGGRSNLL